LSQGCHKASQKGVDFSLLNHSPVKLSFIYQITHSHRANIKHLQRTLNVAMRKKHHFQSAIGFYLVIFCCFLYPYVYPRKFDPV